MKNNTVIPACVTYEGREVFGEIHIWIVSREEEVHEVYNNKGEQ